jgi:hypothetical protein
MTQNRSLQTTTCGVDRISTPPKKVLIQMTGAAAGAAG